MTNVMACRDNSQPSLAVCDYAAWASQQVDGPLTLQHALDEEKYPASADLSGNIGLRSRERVLPRLHGRLRQTLQLGAYTRQLSPGILEFDTEVYTSKISGVWQMPIRRLSP